MLADIRVLGELSWWLASFSTQPQVGINGQKWKHELWIHQLSTGIAAFWVLICWNKDYEMIIYMYIWRFWPTNIVQNRHLHLQWPDNHMLQTDILFECFLLCSLLWTNVFIILIFCQFVVIIYIPTYQYWWILSITPLVNTHGLVPFSSDKSSILML